jgi:recombination protein RecA
MSSVVVPTSAALGRPFLFDAECEAGERLLAAEPKKPARHASSSESVIASVSQSKIGNRQLAIPLTPASHLAVRPAPEMVTSGIVELDALTGGLPRGCLTEIYGTASSGRTSVMLAGLAVATRRGEYCALIDASDALDPQSVAASGIDLDRLLWVRCHDDAPRKSQRVEKSSARIPTARELGFSSSAFDFEKKKARESEHRLEQVLRVTDLLLESGGFGLIVLDLADLPPQAARRIPLTTWFRFRRAVEHKPTMLLVLEQQPIAGSCSSLVLRLQPNSQFSVSGAQYSVLSSNRNFNAVSSDSPASHTQLLTGLEINVEMVRTRLERKPSQSVMFETQAAWAG